MKTPTKILLAITAAAALSFAHPAKANLITNPGFETGDFTGWTTSGSTFVTANPPWVHSGTWAGALNSTNATISQSVATTPGTTYTIDFFARALFLDTNFTVNFGNTVFNYLLTANGLYTELTFNATVSGANTNLSFHNPNGTVFLDDISVTPTGVPDGGTTVSLLGCALLGLAGLRRKLSC